MTDLDKTVFLSYRRKVSWSLAHLVRKDLVEHGYDVFLDVRSIGSGKFERAILGEIAARSYFIVLLEPLSLHRVTEPGDWLCREIAHALKLDRTVVPVLASGAMMPGAGELPADIARLPSYNALTVHDDNPDAALREMRERFLRPASPPPRQEPAASARPPTTSAGDAARVADPEPHAPEASPANPAPQAPSVAGLAAGSAEPERPSPSASSRSPWRTAPDGSAPADDHSRQERRRQDTTWRPDSTASSTPPPTDVLSSDPRPERLTGRSAAGGGNAGRRPPARRPARRRVPPPTQRNPDLVDRAIDGVGRGVARAGRSVGRGIGRTREIDPVHRRGGLGVLVVVLAVVVGAGVWAGAGGTVGQRISDALGAVVGLGAQVVPVLLFVVGVMLMTTEAHHEARPRLTVGSALLALGALGLVHILTGLPIEPERWHEGGGIVGYLAAIPLATGLTVWAAVPVLTVLTGYAFLVLIDTPLREIPDRIRRMLGRAVDDEPDVDELA